MADQPDDGEVLLAVFETSSAADQAVAAVRLRSIAEVRSGEPSAAALARQTEMEAEADESWALPAAGVVYPREAARGLALLAPVGALIGAVVVLPVGFIPVDDVALWARLLIAAAVGAMMGLTVALVAAPALAARRPDDPMASEQGVIVTIDDVSPEVIAAVRSCDPLRIDRVRVDGSRIDTLADRRPSDSSTILGDVVTRSSDPAGDADMQSGPLTNRPVTTDRPRGER